VKRYGQRCPTARALDVVGERWTPLLVRELLLGPKRFTDLLDGLPGIGTNILTSRLAHLQNHGVVAKHQLPRPTPVVVYELTEAGRALAPVLRELRNWGEHYGQSPHPGDAARAAWILQSAAGRNPRSLQPRQSCELRIGEEAFSLAGGEEGIEITAGAAATPDTVVTIDPQLFFHLATGTVGAADASRQIDAAGDRHLAKRVLTMLAGSAS
jgi:DNA-binding HxlR family transcriptional regulator